MMACFRKPNILCSLDETSLRTLEESCTVNTRDEHLARIRKWLDESSDHRHKSSTTFIGRLRKLRFFFSYRNGSVQRQQDPCLDFSLPRRSSEFDSCYSESWFAKHWGRHAQDKNWKWKCCQDLKEKPEAFVGMTSTADFKIYKLTGSSMLAIWFVFDWLSTFISA